MKSPTKLALALLIVAVGIAAGTPALARAYGHGGHGHGGSVRFGLFVGAPVVLSSGYWGPHYYYPSPYYSPYYPPAVTVPVSPPTYVEQGQMSAPAAPAAPQAGYWYYCNDARAYYPYVKECPGGWQRVSPQPPPG